MQPQQCIYVEKKDPKVKNIFSYNSCLTIHDYIPQFFSKRETDWVTRVFKFIVETKVSLIYVSTI